MRRARCPFIDAHCTPPPAHARTARSRNRPPRPVPRLVGRRIARLTQRRRDLRVPLPAKFAQRVEGRTVRAIDRRAKYLLLRLDDGQTLIAHLGMSGRMTLHDAASAAEHPFERHDHVVFETDEGWQVRFNDARRFGLMLLVADEALPSTSCSRAWGPSRWRRLRRRGAGAPARRPQDADQGRAARPEDPGRRRQHLCLRGAVPGGHLAPALGPHGAGRACRPAGRRHQARAATARSTTAARPCATTSSRAASSAISRRASRSTTARARSARRRGCGKPVRRVVQAGRSTFYCTRCQR